MAPPVGCLPAADILIGSTAHKVHSATPLDNPKDDTGLQTVKVMALAIVPILALVALASSALAKSVREFDMVKTAMAQTESAIDTVQLVSEIQVERGTTAMYLISPDESTQQFAARKLEVARADVDAHFRQIPYWRSIRIKSREFTTTQSLKFYIEAYRKMISKQETSIDETIEFFTSIVMAILDSINMGVEMPTQSDLWMEFVALRAILRMLDSIGIQRALGSSFLVTCDISVDNQKWFNTLEARIIFHMKQLFYHHENTTAMKYITDGHAASLSVLNAQMTFGLQSADFQNRCANESTAKRLEMSMNFFDNVTDNMHSIAAFRTQLILGIVSRLAGEHNMYHIQLILYSLMVVGVVIVCGFISSFVHKMSQRIHNNALILIVKNTQLEAERSRAQELLYEMLPASVADQLKVGGQVEPQYFSGVTICFSDIDGFADISATSTPIQIVDLLNDVYSEFDATIERFDVYKVETVGDAYMVASGLPVPNGERHSSEIATMSLELLQVTSRLRVPHLAGRKLSLRVGIHSGDCVAGVVGVTMPRFCLFGDTVNTASRMQSRGEAERIHISETTNNLLTKTGEFVTELRGTVDIKGKGVMTTYWLNQLAPCGRPTGRDALSLTANDE